jgi:hypothetical protein
MEDNKEQGVSWSFNLKDSCESSREVMKINLPFFLSDLKEEIKIPIN